MEITEIFYPKNRAEWRNWLENYHQSKEVIWLRLFRKDSGKPSLPYNDLVEECLCFGWIDGVVKKLDTESRVQRITPRRKKTFLSELNRQRIWKLQRLGLMTPFGIAPLANQIGSKDDPWEIPDWIKEALQKDPEVWNNFEAFPHLYKRLKVGWITEAAKSRVEERQKRLAYLIKMTKKNRQYGTIPEVEEI